MSSNLSNLPCYNATMCGRFSLTLPTESISESLGSSINVAFAPSYNIAPGQQIIAVRQSDGDQPEATSFHWGLIPSWAKDPSVGYKMINARSETVAEKPSFRSAYQSRRCLIPANGFYEWKRQGKQKQAYYFNRTDNQIFFFAGIWERWAETDEGRVVESCTIITTGANDLLAPIHHRMPVIINREQYSEWLSGSLDKSLMAPKAWPDFGCYPVTTYVNSARNQGAACISHYNPSLGPLFSSDKIR